MAVRMRLYQYVGPKGIADRVRQSLRGTPVHTPEDIRRWALASAQDLVHDGYVTATFVVDSAGTLLIADRRSEHVACAGGKPVRSAGEMTFNLVGASVRVIAVSNQSTGYCPEPESWPAVASALAAARLESPRGFTWSCDVRLCVGCGNRNLVKDGVFECAVCGRELPTVYNCQTE
jgi:hypothetical protein